MTTRRALRVAGTVLAAGLLLGGCSGGGAPGPVIGDPLPAPTTAAPTTPEPVAPAPAAPPTTGPTTAPATQPAGGGSGPPRCTTAELRGSLTDPEGAAGSTYRTLVLTNAGDRTCELTGFPGVSYVTGETGDQVGPAAAMDGERGGQVRLDVGAAAGAEVRFATVQNFDAGVCRPTPTRGLRVYPPGDTASLFVPADGTGCAGTPPGDQLTVTTLTPR